MEKEKESFVFYRSFKVALSELNDGDKLIMYEAISDYALDRNEPKLEGFPKALFSLIKPQLDANWKRYEAGIENGHKGKEYGKLGGRPKKAKTLKKPSNNPQETLTEPANVNENENVNDIYVYSFDQFWIDYDKKVGKEKSSQKWEKLSEADKLKIKERLPEYVAATPDKKYRKDPVTYLSQKSWKDEIVPNGVQIPSEKPTKKYEEITL